MDEQVDDDAANSPTPDGGRAKDAQTSGAVGMDQWGLSPKQETGIPPRVNLSPAVVFRGRPVIVGDRPDRVAWLDPPFYG